MSASTATQAHIAYELIDDSNPEVVVVEFLTEEIIAPHAAHELRDELDSLIRPDFPRSFVIDFGSVRTLGSSAFAAFVSFARQVDRLFVCNIRGNLRLGAALSGLDEHVEFFPNRRAAINEARRAAISQLADTVDYPVMSD
jgi:anti-anti-sigma regulatory factor